MKVVSPSSVLPLSRQSHCVKLYGYAISYYRGILESLQWWKGKLIYCRPCYLCLLSCCFIFVLSIINIRLFLIQIFSLFDVFMQVSLWWNGRLLYIWLLLFPLLLPYIFVLPIINFRLFLVQVFSLFDLIMQVS